MNESSPLFGELMVRLGLVTSGQLKEALAYQKLTGQRVGEALVSLGYVRREQLQSALLEALGLSGPGPAPRQLLGELIVRLKHASAEQVADALDEHRRSGRRLGEVLVERGFCSYDQVYEALALQQKGALLEAAPAQQSGAPAARTRVMVVDDSPISAAMVEGGLAELGYEVFAFNQPFDALESLFKLKPSIVLSDLEMPGISGEELCRRIKAGPLRQTPVIILTANDADTQRVSGLRAGADDYVSKSASMDEIAARIESVVRRTGETDRVRKMFARYTSDAVVDELLGTAAPIVLTGEKRDVSVLFADIRNFTGIAESLPPEAVVSMLNEVLGPLAEVVLTCGGTLDKFLGDGLMAVFGAPVRHSDDALRAVQAARMMMEQVAQLNARRQGIAAPLALGIGINSGPAVTGSFGSEARSEYTCIGDTVNVAARLCAIAGGGEILVGERTRTLAHESGRFEPLEPVKLKGKSQPVPIFRAVWAKQEAAQADRSA